MLELIPMTIGEAREYIRKHHRHHEPPVGALFAVGVATDGEVVGVATVGRPVARGNQDDFTAEVTRCCTDGTKNACSMLYGAAWRAARALGYRRLITYTHKDESGASLRAAGWRIVGQVKARSWFTQSRPRVDKHPMQERWKWEAV
jgi:L-amino acid N-acyltransferase YncA